MLESYRLKRAKKRVEAPRKMSVTRKGKLAGLLLLVLTMSIITYAICFAFRTPVVPNMNSYKSTQVHIVSTINFTYTSDLLTNQKRELFAEKIPPHYKIAENSLKNAEELKNRLLAFFNAHQADYEQSVETNKQNVFLEETSATLRKSSIFEVAPQDIGIIYANADEKLREVLFSRAIFFVKNILSDGVYQDEDKAFSEAGDWINPVSNVNRSTSKLAVSETRARRELLEKVRMLSTTPQMARALYRIFNQCITPNIEFDPEITKKKRDEARASIQPVQVKIREGETLADSESLNSPLAKERLRAYKTEILKRGEGDMNNIPKYVNFMMCILLMLLAALFIIISRNQKNKRPKAVYIFCSLLILNLIVERFTIDTMNAHNWDESLSWLQVMAYATPLILTPIVQVLLFGSYMGFIMSIVITSLTTLMMSETMPFFILNLTASVVAIYHCNEAKNRFRVIRAGVVYGAFVALVVLLMGLCTDSPLPLIGRQSIAALLGGVVTSILALALLPIIEYVFKQNSNISLIDYTDINNPKAGLLAKLQIVAPGSYHHAVMVSHVAEAAAEAVKANAMVCKVGALYHDIGKLTNPEFFAENQNGENPHDEQEPSMSALIIKNHVSEGIAQAEAMKMPNQIIDAIRQHHGTSIISYFYNKAKKAAGGNIFSTDQLNKILREEGIDEESYRHNGEKPKTVENAIIMIADSCEAAVRSIKKPTKHGVETMVDAIVNGKMTDGQFDECPITVKQISTIKRTVIQTLLNMLHTRVEYKA